MRSISGAISKLIRSDVLDRIYRCKNKLLSMLQIAFKAGITTFQVSVDAGKSLLLAKSLHCEGMVHSQQQELSTDRST